MLPRFVLIIPLLIFIAIMDNEAYADSQFIQRVDVQEFIDAMVKNNGFNKKKLISLFATVKVRPQVIQHINKPLEKEPWDIYQMLFVTQSNIENGVKFWNKYLTTLEKAEKVYGVPPNIIVATIGIETKYGQKTGSYRVIDSLCSLGFSHSPRAPFFRNELKHFLILTRDQHLNPSYVLGSYAGAIGQPQFMPSSYRNFAVNFSKSGKIDLMHNVVDVIGSIANYYQKNGWTPNQAIVAQALIIGDRYHYLIRKGKITQPLTISELAKLGIIPKVQITPESLKVKVIELQNHYSKEYWLGFHNFDVIKRYNSSDLYAMAVYQLGYYITALKEKSHNG